jgi:hypothetical protein
MLRGEAAVAVAIQPRHLFHRRVRNRSARPSTQAPIRQAKPASPSSSNRRLQRRNVRSLIPSSSVASNCLSFRRLPAAQHVSKLQHPQALPLLRPAHHDPRQGRMLPNRSRATWTGQIVCYLRPAACFSTAVQSERPPGRRQSIERRHVERSGRLTAAWEGVAFWSDKRRTPRCTHKKTKRDDCRRLQIAANYQTISTTWIGGRTRTRTLDPLIKSQLLYQLSYAPPAAHETPSTARRGRAIATRAGAGKSALLSLRIGEVLALLTIPVSTTPSDRGHSASAAMLPCG